MPQAFEISIQGWGLNFYLQLERPLCYFILLVATVVFCWRHDKAACEALPHYLLECAGQASRLYLTR